MQESFWEARQARDEALSHVEIRSAAWRAVAMEYLVHYARHHSRMTSEDLWGVLWDAGIGAPEEPRAMGPVMLKAVALDYLKPLGYVPGRRVAAHGRPVREYLSLIYGEKS